MFKQVVRLRIFDVYKSRRGNYVGSMKTARSITVGVALLLLAGCATTFRPWKLSDVKEGMSKKQVVGLLGQPDSVQTKNGEEILHYSYSEAYNPPPAGGLSGQPPDSPEQRIQAQEIKRSVKEHNYVVRLVDGKVQSYEEVGK